MDHTVLLLFLVLNYISYTTEERRYLILLIRSAVWILGAVARLLFAFLDFSFFFSYEYMLFAFTHCSNIILDVLGTKYPLYSFGQKKFLIEMKDLYTILKNKTLKLFNNLTI